MRRLMIFAFGVTSYVVFFGTFLYAVGFLGDFWVPRTIDGPATVPFWRALLIDVGLLALFAVQHSVMARPAFKRWWTRIIPSEAERSVYVLCSSAALVLLFVAWQPLGGVVWDVADPVGRGALHTLFAVGWLTVLASTFLINHFDLFGLRQVWLCLRGRPYVPLRFATPGLYRHVRHPLYVGWLMVFWATPTMTVTHLLFALATTGYILAAIPLEERDLLAAHGSDYRAYRERTPKLIPRLGGGEDVTPTTAHPGAA
jgi:protein-S-isoprenylcysteine O-methyltransferase Ste14